MVAADGVLRERMAVVVRRAETDGDARQPGDRLDDPDELRRPEHAAELPEARREIGDADGAAVAVGQHGGDDRGVAQIFRLEIGHVVEHDVGESLLLVARQQAAEDRVAVEARKAPPHHARRGIDQRSRAAVADDGKIEPVIDHEAASASVREICSSQRRTSLGRSKQDSTPGTLRPTEIANAVEFGHDREHASSVTSSPMKIGRRPANGAMRHQFAHGRGLGEPGLLDLHHQLARQQLDRAALSSAQILAAASRTMRSLSGASR